MNAKYENLLVTTDLSDFSTVAFDHVSQLLSLIGQDKAKVTVLKVFEDFTASDGTTVPGRSVIQASGVMNQSYQKSQDELKTLCSKHFGSFPVQQEIIRTAKSPAQAIIDYASEKKIDLIVMSSTGRSKLSKFLLGSTAERVLRAAPCPVLLVPSTNR